MAEKDFDLDAFTKNVSGERPPFDNSNDDPEGYNVDDASDGWVPEDALADLVEQRSLDPSKTNVDLAKRELDQSAPAVAKSIVRLALYSKSESVRLRSGQYVLDKVLDYIGAQKSPLEELMEGVTLLTEQAAKENGEGPVVIEGKVIELEEGTGEG